METYIIEQCVKTVKIHLKMMNNFRIFGHRKPRHGEFNQ